MKRKVTTSIYAPLRWLSLVVVMLVSVQGALANTNTFYYNATATSSPQAAGKVYISSTSNNNPPYQNGSSTTGTQNFDYVGNSGNITLYMYAQPRSDSYLFQNWTYNNQVVSTNPSYNVTVTVTSQNSWSPNRFNYTANFISQMGLIKVRTDNPDRGSVTISNPNNGMEDVVTLNALPDVSNGVLFEGWKKDSGTEFVSTDNPLVLTVSDETKGTYVAHFTEPADNVFVRLQNKKTGRFLSFYGDRNGRGADVHNRTIQGNTAQDGFKFDACWKLISAADAQGNPETVFRRAGHPGGTGITWGADLVAHGLAYSSLIHEGSTNRHMLRMEQSGNTFRIFTTFTNSGVTFNSYFCDEGGNWLVMKSMDQIDESAEWYIYTLDENSTVGAFGANAKEKYTREGKYYTTMYTDFPYQCKDGVKVYYLTKDDNENVETEHVVHFTEITNGMVPANMAVVLECPTPQNDISSTNVVCNRLIPLITEVPQIINPGLHPLKGYVSVNGSTVPNDYSTMYVLSYDDPSKENHLGFYHYSKSAMTPNKAYLEIPKDVAENNNVTVTSFVFGKDSQEETDKITVYNLFVADDDAPIYDLLGRKVEGILPKGIYIRNGKKFIVK
jgi:hypothetical protein